MEKTVSYIISRLEGFMKFRNVTKKDLATKWKKTGSYVSRRFRGEVEFSLTDILELTECLDIPKKEAADIFFGCELRNT
ncbi:MAG: helix-turn-helix transcriptional regulator [Clostridia bacterium]|nr:helix-turn-helix transcriptional regulator [Clostridia bacterium]